MGNVVMYVDGFNLFYGLRAKYAHAYHWLDLFALACRIRQHDTVVKVRYFTAIVAGEPDAARRQEDYLAALCAHRPEVDVARGRFKVKKPRCHLCGTRWTCRCAPPVQYRTYEEKLTDVALGVAMVEDAATGVGDISVLVSTDTDLHPAIDASLRVAPTRPVYLACPPGREPTSRSFVAPVTSFRINESHLKASILPPAVLLPNGRTVARPAKWH